MIYNITSQQNTSQPHKHNKTLEKRRQNTTNYITDTKQHNTTQQMMTKYNTTQHSTKQQNTTQ